MDIFILSLISWFLFIIIKSKKSLHMLQQNSYDERFRYLKWIKTNFLKVHTEPDSLVFLLLVFLYLLFKDLYFMIIYFLLYFAFFLTFLKRKRTEQVKKPLVITPRVRRLIITIAILYLIPLIIIWVNYRQDRILIYYIILSALTYLNYFVTFLASKMNYPIERLVFYSFRRKAKKKLSEFSNLKVIGITGSFGKTSSKNILNDILDIKYNTLASPKSFNTPYGLIMTTNNNLTKFHEVFIAEMGAKNIGDIKELCDLVNPKYGILTKIGPAHLESFKTIENVTNTKFELIESLPKDGIGILNGDDNYQINYKIKSKCKKLWIGIKNKDVDTYAFDISASHEGTSFKVKFKDLKEKHEFQTKLLGTHSVYNILAAITLGRCLGLSIDELKRGVKRIKPIEHRLSLKEIGPLTIIDDAYNSNPEGSKAALEVLKMMPGKKIIITPGMIELGELQYDANKEFGKNIADTCDEAILVGKKQTQPIYDGLKEKGYKEKNIHAVDTVKEAILLATKLRSNETYVLLENDLPDIFNE